MVSASPRCLFLGDKRPRERKILPNLQKAGRTSGPVEKGPESLSLTDFQTQVSLHIFNKCKINKGKGHPATGRGGPRGSG